MIGLTPRQRELLAYLRERDTCPTYREMGRALGYAESNLTQPIHDLLNALEERGYIRRIPGRWRAIEVLPHPVVINGESYRFIPKTRAA